MLTDHHGDDAAIVPYLRACAAVAASPIPTMAGDVSVTISVGVKIWRPDETEDELFAAADTALYEAKAGGRNRVVLSGPVGQQPG